jgi:hypothetical protein
MQIYDTNLLRRIRFRKVYIFGGLQLIQILGLMGFYFDTAVLFVRCYFQLYSDWPWPYCGIHEKKNSVQQSSEDLMLRCKTNFTSGTFQKLFFFRFAYKN